jgi:hypothetical protein
MPNNEATVVSKTEEKVSPNIKLKLPLPIRMSDPPIF